LKTILDFKKEFNPEDPNFKIEEDTPDYIRKDIKSCILMYRFVKLFDDMPDGLG